MQNVVGPLSLPWQRNFGKCGLFLHKIAQSPISRLVWHIHRKCLGLPGGRPGGGDLCCYGIDICARRGVYIRLPACFFFLLFFFFSSCIHSFIHVYSLFLGERVCDVAFWKEELLAEIQRMESECDNMTVSLLVIIHDFCFLFLFL